MSSSPPPRAQAGDVQCRVCGSRVRPEEDWCSLCLTPVKAPAAPDPAPVPVAQAPPPSPPPVTPISAEVTARAEQLIAQLALAESGRGWSAAPRQRLSGRDAAVIAAGGAALLLVLMIVGMTLIGLLL